MIDVSSNILVYFSNIYQKFIHCFRLQIHWIEYELVYFVFFFVFYYCYLFAGWMEVFEFKFYMNYLDLEYDGTEFGKLRSVHAIRPNVVWNPTCQCANVLYLLMYRPSNVLCAQTCLTCYRGSRPLYQCFLPLKLSLKQLILMFPFLFIYLSLTLIYSFLILDSV